jgi:predicted N-acyltransferase
VSIAQEIPQQSARPQAYTTEIWRSVDEIDAGAWEHVRDPDDLFMDRRLLQVVARSLSGEAAFRYVLIRDPAGEPAAIAYLSTMTIDGTLLAGDGWLRRLVRLVGKIAPPVVHYRILLCGTPLSAGQSHLRFARGADRKNVLAALDRLLTRVAREDGARCVVLKEFSPEELRGLQAFGQLGYHRADSLPMNETGLRRRTWDAYLNGLDHKRRQKVHQAQKKLARAGVEIVITSDPAEVERRFTGDVYRLYEAVAKRADINLSRIPAEFFRELARQLTDHCDYVFLTQRDQIRAFGVCLHSGECYDPLFLGIDYERNQQHELYFNLLYGLVFAALRRHASHIRFGATADQVKRERLGCHQTPRYFLIKGCGFVLTVVLRLLSSRLFPAREAR